MSAEAATPTAFEAEAQAAAEEERGRRLGAQAADELAVARRAFEDAERARDEALESRVRGEEDADDRVEAALREIQDAASDVSLAQSMVDAGERVRERARERKRQVRIACVDELSLGALELAQEAIEARDALAAAIEEYVTRYRAAKTRWGDLREGAIDKIEGVDAAKGDYRSDDRVMTDATCPDCPLSQEMINAVLSTTPVPPIFAPEESGLILDLGGDDRPVPIFQGDPNHQRHVKGVPDAPRPGQPLNGMRLPDEHKREVLRAEGEQRKSVREQLGI